MRVRITATPRERELDGVTLDRFTPRTVRDLSAQLAIWLIAQGYAEPEMRHGNDDEMDFSGPVKPARSTAEDRGPRRRSTDR